MQPFFFRIDDEIIVNTDLAEFIDNDGIALAVRLREDPVEQRGLSRTEITGDHRDGSLVQSRLHGIFPLLMLRLLRAGQRRCPGTAWSFRF
jgi:hypothetical protein